MALNRQYFCECKSQNKSLIRKKNRRCEMMKLDKLEQLRHSKPRYFWKYFNNKSNANSADSIPLNIFHNYFLNLENELFQTVNDDVNSVRLKGFVSDICIILTTYNLCHIIYDYFCSNSLPSKAQWKREISNAIGEREERLWLTRVDIDPDFSRFKHIQNAISPSVIWQYPATRSHLSLAHFVAKVITEKSIRRD